MSFSFEPQGSLSEIKQKLSSLIEKYLPLKKEEIYDLLEQPHREEHGHISLPLFRLSHNKNQSPRQEAEKFVEQIKHQVPPFLKEVTAISGFINFHFEKEFLKSQMEKLLSKKKSRHLPKYQ